MSFDKEPVMWLAVIDAALSLLLAFGVPITNDEKIAVIGFAQAAIAIIFGFIARSQVTPVK